MCDERGNIVNGDQILAIAAARKKSAGTLAKNTLVATVMSNLGLEIAMSTGNPAGPYGVETDMVESMRKNANLAGSKAVI